MFNIKSKNNKEKGVAVLFAVLVAVLMVSVAATMVSIAIRQTILSNTGRDSQYAMFAANTALECALYWDLKDLKSHYSVDEILPTEKIFPNIDNGEELIGNYAGWEDDTKCNGGSIVNGSGFDSDFAKRNWEQIDGETTFFMEIRPEVDGTYYGPYCAKATVKKSMRTVGGGVNEAVTVIEARGYNTCDLSSPRAIERGLELSYTS